MGGGSLCPPVHNNIVTPLHLFSFLLVLIHDKQDLSKLAKKKKSLKVPKRVISVQNCMENLLFGGFKALQGALKNAPQRLLKRNDQ